MIRGASVYDAADPLGSGLRVLVMRQWPRGVRKTAVDLWLKEAGPSRELLRAYHDGELQWEGFEQRYRDEMLKARPAILDELRKLEREHGSLTLLCFERIPPAEHCHRQVLLSLLETPP